MKAAVKPCDACGRPIFGLDGGTVTIAPPARVEKVEANGNIVAICRCRRRVVWFRVKRPTRVSVSSG